MSDFVPDVDMIRDSWGESDWFGSSRESFERWLAEYTRQQREEAFREGVHTGWIGTNRTLSSVLSDNPYRKETP